VECGTTKERWNFRELAYFLQTSARCVLWTIIRSLFRMAIICPGIQSLGQGSRPTTFRANLLLQRSDPWIFFLIGLIERLQYRVEISVRDPCFGFRPFSNIGTPQNGSRALVRGARGAGEIEAMLAWRP